MIHSLGRKIRETADGDERLRAALRLVDAVGGADRVQAEVRTLGAQRTASAGMKSTPLLERLERLVTETQQEAMSHPMLQEDVYRSMTPDQVNFFARQCYEFVRHFPRFLGALISQIPESEGAMLMVLIDNLVDECGGYDKLEGLTDSEDADISGTHPKLYRDFLVRLGFDIDTTTGEPEDVAVDPATQWFIDEYYNLCGARDFLWPSVLLAQETSVSSTSGFP